MLKRILTVGLLAGLVAGLAMAVLQHFTTVPIILAAEVYEAGAAAHGALSQEAAVTTQFHGAHGHGAWTPATTWERTLATLGATLAAGIGFSLILIAALLFAGGPIRFERAVVFAAGGFAATGLATGLGLAPELPGSAAADLASRQLWWIGTALATALGLYLIFKNPRRWLAALGLGLIVLPHAVGAPEAEVFSSSTPAELAARFASVSLAVHAAFWLMIGMTVGAFWQCGEVRAER